MKPRVSSARSVRVLLATGFLVCFSVAATAGELSATYFRIDVESDLGSASYEVLTQDVDYDPATQTWSWSGGGVQLGDIAFLDQATLTIVGDPQIAMGFAMTAGAADTNVTISSALLSFDGLVNPDGAASVGLTLTETNGDTATLTGLGGVNGSAYVASYNTPPGTVFAEFVTLLYEPDAYDSTSQSDSTGGWITIPDTVTDIQAQFSFNLTAFDQASGTSNYLVVPEPASLVLLALGGLAVAGRRR